jgi:ATP adenylyltransferase
MEHLWAPWRIDYIAAPKPEGCIFCDKPAESKDEANYLLHRGKSNFVILNAFPYNPGHLMVVPFRHVGRLEDLADDEALEHWTLVKQSMMWIEEVMAPHGFNTGMNFGRVAGAGILDHLHTHVIPRWEGDVNLITVISDTRVVPEALAATYHRLKQTITKEG